MIEAPPGGRGRVIGGGIGLGLLAGGGIVCARALLADPAQRDQAFWFGLMAWVGVLWLRAWWRRRLPGPETARPPAALAPSIALALVPGAMLAWYTATEPRPPGGDANYGLITWTILVLWLGIIGLRSSRGIRRLETSKTQLPRWPLPVVVVLALVPGVAVLWFALATPDHPRLGTSDDPCAYEPGWCMSDPHDGIPSGVILTGVGLVAIWLAVQERRQRPGAVGEPEPAEPASAEPAAVEAEPPLDPTLEEIAERAERRGGGREP